MFRCVQSGKLKWLFRYAHALLFGCLIMCIQSLIHIVTNRWMMGVYWHHADSALAFRNDGDSETLSVFLPNMKHHLGRNYPETCFEIIYCTCQFYLSNCKTVLVKLSKLKILLNERHLFGSSRCGNAIHVSFREVSGANIFFSSSDSALPSGRLASSFSSCRCLLLSVTKMEAAIWFMTKAVQHREKDQERNHSDAPCSSWISSATLKQNTKMATITSIPERFNEKCSYVSNNS